MEMSEKKMERLVPGLYQTAEEAAAEEEAFSKVTWDSKEHYECCLCHKPGILFARETDDENGYIEVGFNHLLEYRYCSVKIPLFAYPNEAELTD